MPQDVRSIQMELVYVTQDLWEFSWKPGELPAAEQGTQHNGAWTADLHGELKTTRLGKEESNEIIIQIPLGVLSCLLEN